MRDPGVRLIRSTQIEIVDRVFIKGFNAKRAAERDHSRARFDVCETATLVDALATDDA